MSGAKRIHRVSLVVAQAADLGGNIREIVLRDEGDWDLPPFTAGAHIDVHIPVIGVRQYSLAGDPSRSDEWRIAVLREVDGRGGSRAMHALEPGQEVLCSLPRNHFPFPTDRPVTMVAGGIGITPFLSAIPGMRQQGQPFELHYCARTPDHAPLAARLPEANLHVSSAGHRLDMRVLIDRFDRKAHLFVCGPARMIDEALHLGDGLGDRLHVERFGTDTGSDPAYTVRLARQNREIPVAAGETMLQALRNADVDIPASCEGGICLECKTRWLAGTPVHRELAMPKSDRDQWITPCVSSCAGDCIVLDL